MDLYGALWYKSSYSNGTSSNCVEVGHLPGAYGMRDSKHPDDCALVFSPGEWAAFLGQVRGS
ncbi:DUF397 domain-containing protein [Salinactinospora qingdaonensis]|uniref:DUF397 domain-containing protein n=1 Tax=Salinactinospora qingdaonensis TaxID=702744 RepID=A0ABP7FM01_9ACTN